MPVLMERSAFDIDKARRAVFRVGQRVVEPDFLERGVRAPVTIDVRWNRVPVRVENRDAAGADLNEIERKRHAHDELTRAGSEEQVEHLTREEADVVDVCRREQTAAEDEARERVDRDLTNLEL